MVLQTVGASFVHAAGEVKPDVTITDFSIVDQKGEYGGYERFKLALKWDATKYNNTLKEGDYFDVTLPDNMVFPTASSATHFPLRDSEGNVVANAVVSPNPNGGGKVRATFTSYVNGRYNVKGTMFLEANFSQDKLKYGQVNKFKVVVGKTTKEINVKIKGPVGKPTEQLGKWAEEIPGKDDQIKWSLRINFSSGNLTNLKIEDKLLSNETIIDNSFKVYSIHWNDLGHYKGSKELTGAIIKLAPDKKSFTVDLSNVKPYIPSGFDANGNVTSWKLSGRPAGDLTGAQVYINYKTTYTSGTKVGNNAKAFSPVWKTPKDVTFEYKSASSGGTGEGNKGKVKIVKVDAINPNIKLPQAKFEIRVKDTDKLIETMVTGDNGEAISKTTLDPTKKYVLKEISTPPGYQVESTSENLEFTPDLNKLTTVAVKNKRILTDICGRKTWANDDGYNVRPSQITIQLVADGKDVPGKTQIVKPDQNGDWKYEFKNLPKYRTDKRDANGDDIPIVYTVKEVQVPEGYTSEVSGMNVKNTFTPKEYDFKFRKTDVAGKELAGAKIKLSSDDGRATIKENGVKVPSVEWISDGTAKQLTLEPGNYTFVETAAPEGFSLATTIKFTVNKDGSVTGTTVKVDGSTTIISMVDDYKYHPVTVSKVDLGGTELPGAKITVKSADGTNLISDNGKSVNSVSWESTNTAKELKLRAGKYVFHEEAAP
ncbi:MAG: Cna B-type domain-containing protein, partial [Parvimonas sp.]|nr:Cna B-type domain-containing protein [Parvimonas sp.]